MSHASATRSTPPTIAGLAYLHADEALQTASQGLLVVVAEGTCGTTSSSWSTVSRGEWAGRLGVRGGDEALQGFLQQTTNLPPGGDRLFVEQPFKLLVNESKPAHEGVVLITLDAQPVRVQQAV